MIKIMNASVKYFIPLLFIATWFCAPFNAVADTADSVKTSPQEITDTTKSPTDSTLAATPEKELPLYNPLNYHGSRFVLTHDNYFRDITKEDIEMEDYYGLQDIITDHTPSYPLSLGAYGHFSQMSFFGAGPRNVNFCFNNRPMNDFGFGSFNPEQFSPEFMEQLEIYTGTEAAILFDDASGAGINIQEIRYNTAKPYTRMFFAESGYRYINADGIYSHNIARNWNFTFGFRSLGSDGRYPNSSVDAWHVRGLLRWNPGDLTSISLTENFYNHGLGLFGGLDYNKSLKNYQSITNDNAPANFTIFDDNFAVDVYPDMVERVFRHDLTLTYTSILDKDSVQAFSGTVFLTYADWNRSSKSGYFGEGHTDGFRMGYISRQLGATADYELNISDILGFKFGGVLDHIMHEKSLFIDGFQGLSVSGYGLTKINLLNLINLTTGIRFKHQKDRNAFSFGAKGGINFSKNFSAFVDLSRSERLPAPAEGMPLGKESNNLALGEIKWDSKKLKIYLDVFARLVSSPILAKPLTDSSGNIYATTSFNGEDRQVYGTSLNIQATPFETINYGSWQFNPFNFSAGINYMKSTSAGANDRRFPEFSGSFSVYGEVTIGESIARVGLELKGLTDYSGESFDPQTRSYYLTDGTSGFMYNGINIFAHARLGNAFVRLTLDNVLSEGIYYVPYYPLHTMNFKLQVSWSFFN